MAVLLSLTINTAQALDNCMTGSWYDPERDGEGINIESDGDVTIAYFYTFNRSDKSVWYTMVGGTYLAMYDTFKVDDEFKDFRTETKLVGTASLEPLGFNNIYFQYEFDLEYKNGVKYYCVGEICKGSYLYRRLTQPIPCGK